MSATVSTTSEGGVVVTHLYVPPAGAAPHDDALTAQRGRLLVLGTIQVMVGLLVGGVGIAMAINPNTLTVFSGIFGWGGALYIASGSLAVAAGKSPERCQINSALVLGIMAAVVALTGTILCSLDAAQLMNPCGFSMDGCSIEMGQLNGVSGVLAFFHLLQLIVSATVAGYTCSQACRCCAQPLSVAAPPVVTVHTHLSGAQPPPSAQVQNLRPIPVKPRPADGAEPPAYVDAARSPPPQMSPP